MSEYKKPETNMELVKRATSMIISPALLKQLMAKKAKQIGSTKTSEIVDAVVIDYMSSTKSDIKKDYTPSDFALFVNLS